MSHPPVSLVSWDVDGTLYSTAAMKRRLARRLWRKPLGLWGLLRTRRFHWAVEASRQNGGDVRAAYASTQRARWIAEEIRWCAPCIAAVGPAPGAISALAAARRLGLVQVAFSDYQPDYKLEALGLRDFFAATFAGEALGFVKPHPAGFEAIQRAFPRPREAILHVGDRADTDGGAAERAGVRVVILGRDVEDLVELAARWPDFVR